MMKLYRISRTLDISVSYYLPALENYYHDEALKLGFSIPDNYKDFENCVKTGFYQPWINDKIKKLVFYMGYFYIPVYKKEAPVNTNKKLIKMWTCIFTLFYPLVYLRFRFKAIGFNFDAFLAMGIIRFFEKKYKIDTNDLNNFMMGINRLEK